MEPRILGFAFKLGRELLIEWPTLSGSTGQKSECLASYGALKYLGLLYLNRIQEL